MTRAAKRAAARRPSAEQVRRADDVRSHPKKGDRIFVGGIGWEVLGRAHDLPGATVRVRVKLGRRREVRVLRVSTWRRQAALAAVLIDGLRIVPPPRPEEPEDPETADLFGFGEEQ